MTGPATSATMAQLFKNGCALSRCSTCPQPRNLVAIGCGCASCAPPRARLRGPLSPQLRSADAALSLRPRCTQPTTITLGSPHSPTPSIITDSPTASLREVSTSGRGRGSADDPRCGVDSQRGSRSWIVRRHIPNLAARPVESFAGLARAKTAASSRTHQRGPQRVCGAWSTKRAAPATAPFQDDRARRASPMGDHHEGRKLPICFPARVLARVTRLILRVNVLRRSVCAHHREGFQARNASTPFALVDTGGERSAAASAARCPRVSATKSRNDPPRGKYRARAEVVPAIPISRPRFPHLFAARCSNIGGHR